MYGLISELRTLPDRRDELIEIIASASLGLPGCVSYIIAADASREDAIWITEVWTDRESHAASLELSAVQEAMTKGRTLITGMGQRTATRPVAGI